MKEILNKFASDFPALIVILTIICCIAISFGANITVDTFLGALVTASIFQIILLYFERNI